MTIPGTARQRWTEIRELTIRLAVEEEGMSTAEYSISFN